MLSLDSSTHFGKPHEKFTVPWFARTQIHDENEVTTEGSSTDDGDSTHFSQNNNNPPKSLFFDEAVFYVKDKKFIYCAKSQLHLPEGKLYHHKKRPKDKKLWKFWTKNYFTLQADNKFFNKIFKNLEL